MYTAVVNNVLANLRRCWTHTHNHPLHEYPPTRQVINRRRRCPNHVTTSQHTAVQHHVILAAVVLWIYPVPDSTQQRRRRRVIRLCDHVQWPTNRPELCRRPRSPSESSKVSWNRYGVRTAACATLFRHGWARAFRPETSFSQAPCPARLGSP